MLKLHKQKYGDDNMSTLRTSPESYIYWKKHFHKNPLYFSKYADFGADNEIDSSIIGNIGNNQLMFTNKPST